MATVPRSAEAERHDPLLAELLGRISEYNANADADLIRAAFDYSCVHHQGQRRKSGEEFIHHPVAVATICAELKLDTATIAAALLHDVVEDTPAELEGERDRFASEAGTILNHELEHASIEADISGRAKHLYSIYMKMAQGGKEFNEIYDLTAVRVLVGSVKDCYGAIGVRTSRQGRGPSRDWMNLVKTPRARNKIRQWFTQQAREDLEQKGRESL